MLHQRRCEPILGIVTLKPFNESYSHGAVEEWIFTVGFLSATPANVASQVGVWRAHHQPSTVVVALEHVTSFVALNCSNLANQFRIPRLAETYRLRKLRGRHHR